MKKKSKRGYFAQITLPRLRLKTMKIEIDTLRQTLTDSIAEHQKTIRELAGVSLDRWKQQKRADRNAEELGRYVVAMKDAVMFIDSLLELGTIKDGWTRADAMKLEGLRFLSLSAEELHEIRNNPGGSMNNPLGGILPQTMAILYPYVSSGQEPDCEECAESEAEDDERG